MPLLATLMASLASGLASLLSVMMGYKLALKLAAYTAWIVVTTAFLATTFICITALWSMAAGFFSGGGSMATVSGAIAIGLGVIIPSNAATVLSCCSSVWIASQVYKLQKQGLIHFGS
jgi:hypothetical protein